jgi:hypothetical protein
LRLGARLGDFFAAGRCVLLMTFFFIAVVRLVME